MIMLYKEIKFCQYIFMEGWQSGQMQRTVTPSGKPYIGSNPIPSTTKKVNQVKDLHDFDPLKNTPKKHHY